VLITKDETLPFDKTALTKSAKADPASFILRPLSFFNEFGIEYRGNAGVKRIDEDAK
jgi:hypothetical protein